MREKINEGQIKFLIYLKDNFNSNSMLEDYSILINEMNDSNIISDRREELEILCYKIPILCIKLHLD